MRGLSFCLLVSLLMFSPIYMALPSSFKYCSRDWSTTTSELIAYWKFDEGQGVIAHDSSGKGNDGGIWRANWTLGVENQALKFAGIVRSYVDIQHALYSTSPAEIAVVAWIFPTSYEGWIVYGGDNGEFELLYTTVEFVGRIAWRVKLENGEWYNVDTDISSFNFVQNNWYFVVGHWKKGSPTGVMELYVEGIRHGYKNDLPDLFLFDPGQGFHPTIGAYDDSVSKHNFFSGIIDEVKIYTMPPPNFTDPPATHMLNITTTVGGTTEPSPGVHRFLVNESVVSVRATAYANYFFHHWEFDGSWKYYSNPINVAMDSNHSLHAVFQYIQSGVGGVVVPVDKLGLLTPYIGLTSTILVTTVAVAIFAKRVKHRKKKQ